MGLRKRFDERIGEKPSGLKNRQDRSWGRIRGVGTLKPEKEASTIVALGKN